MSLLLTNPQTGDVFPVFVYYSFLPYVLPTALTLVGIPAIIAFKIAMGLELLIFGVGLEKLIEAAFSLRSQKVKNAAFLCAALLVTANYVYGLWYQRAALGDIWVYALAPWVIRFAICPHSTRPLAFLFFLQVCGHPLVLVHSLICELVVAFGLSNDSATVIVKRCATPLTLALVLGSPFWLPQFVWMHYISGNAALPVRFSDTFLSFYELVNPANMRNIGLFLLCAIAFMLLVTRANVSWRVWSVLLALLLSFSLQTVYLRSIAIALPVVNEFQFIWRFMLPTSLIAFCALVSGLHTPSRLMTVCLSILTVSSVVWMMLLHVGEILHNVSHLAWLRHNESGYGQYLTPTNLWGVALFAPNYSLLPQMCPEPTVIRIAQFGQLETGLDAKDPFFAIRNGPIGFVTYLADNQEIPMSACRDFLILGPVKLPSRVSVGDQTLTRLLTIRIAVLAIGLVVFLVPVPGSPAPRPA